MGHIHAQHNALQREFSALQEELKLGAVLLLLKLELVHEDRVVLACSLGPFNVDAPLMDVP